LADGWQVLSDWGSLSPSRFGTNTIMDNAGMLAAGWAVPSGMYAADHWNGFTNPVVTSPEAVTWNRGGGHGKTAGYEHILPQGTGSVLAVRNSALVFHEGGGFDTRNCNLDIYDSHSVVIAHFAVLTTTGANPPFANSSWQDAMRSDVLSVDLSAGPGRIRFSEPVVGFCFTAYVYCVDQVTFPTAAPNLVS
jgi:hypothetical protein